MPDDANRGFKGHGNYGQYDDYMTNHKFVANQAKNTARGAGYPNQYYKQLLNKGSSNKAKQNAEIIETGSGHLTDLVPPKFKDQIDAYVKSQSNRQWDIMQQMDKMDGNNPEYLKLKRQREQIKSSYGKGGTLFKQLSEYQKRGLDWTEDFANGNFSIVSDESETSALAEIFGEKGNAQLFIDDIGNIEFGNENMGYTALNDLPDYQNKAYKSSKTLLGNLTKAYASGKKMDDNDVLLARNDFHEIMREEGVDGTMSLAFDNILDPNNSLLNIDDYENTIAAIRGDDAALALEAEKILTNDVMDAYMDKLEKQHQQGYDYVNTPKESGIKTTLGKDIEKWYNDGVSKAKETGKQFLPDEQKWHAKLRNAGYNIFRTDPTAAGKEVTRDGVKLTTTEMDTARSIYTAKLKSDPNLKFSDFLTEQGYAVKEIPASKGQMYIAPRSVTTQHQRELERIKIPNDYLENPTKLIEILKDYDIKV